MAPTAALTYRGVVYRRYPHAPHPSDRDFYRATSGARLYLHRVIYAQHNGPIPPGWRVIHLDGDPLNNAPVNLRAIPAAAPAPRRSLATMRANAAANLNDPAGYPATCQHCGATFTAHRRTAARYCSPAHRVAAFRARTATS